MRDHLNPVVRPRQHRLRNRDCERLGGIHVDVQFELGRLLDGPVARLGAALAFNAEFV